MFRSAKRSQQSFRGHYVLKSGIVEPSGTRAFATAASMSLRMRNQQLVYDDCGHDHAAAGPQATCARSGGAVAASGGVSDGVRAWGDPQMNPT